MFIIFAYLVLGTLLIFSGLIFFPWLLFRVAILKNRRLPLKFALIFFLLALLTLLLFQSLTPMFKPQNFLLDYLTSLAKTTPSPPTPPPHFTLYQHPRLGFAFFYPETWEVRTGVPAVFITTNQGKSIDTVLIPKFYQQDSGLPASLIAFASLDCDASGPQSSTSCPQEKISITPYLNPLKTEGYLLRRTFVEYRYPPQSSLNEFTQTISAFPLTSADYIAVIFTSRRPDADTEIRILTDNFFYPRP
ncbi:hypothetical protein A3H89_00490 [Candidatus Amesbacteria bacterium RIFCSPLOWO2_02_FULL_48_11]|uniref:Uncharacterized protein n=2 Tax=Candidatus Amesiibacteriota TaxID=1752730 RepID=A0A1F4ZAG6_9BACT|nr:MAG: hypothetical protein A3C34_02440 [Candidatus Amesbacteria bacterium RIFCSPHIGHO2_02_FULL_48_21]OGC97176.1 MAG: hypothetical protein A2W16_02850 [Candidatus Amesbacteria bacterium RBG_16_48_31]OGD02384.1 MAG: hypothetical protein A3E17_04805 [Candidatus Amesbacteria bacterium RIFCSPHIGHO2_12_FULL_48_14]OGD02467.1 MAG: hypothetical protein A2354_01825 [Candidatus Amesbacteria bacterium RIFOXYB1_FULL_47_12]OGD06387.1 MAG: hypothetical protein A3B58_01160 [Candidatus Amesbacteria bacterium 